MHVAVYRLCDFLAAIDRIAKIISDDVTVFVLFGSFSDYVLGSVLVAAIDQRVEGTQVIGDQGCRVVDLWPESTVNKWSR